MNTWHGFGKLIASAKPSSETPTWQAHPTLKGKWELIAEGYFALNIKSVLYGWVELNKDGQFLAQCPKPYDEETDSDATEQMPFSTLSEAIAWVEANHGGYGI